MRHYNAEVEKFIKTNSQLSENEKEIFAKENREKMLRLLEYEKSIINTNYHKVMIEGHTGIYLAHPHYQHSDDNKRRVFDINEQTLELIQYFNAEIEAYKNRLAT